MKRICYVIPTLKMGGTERQLVELLRGLVHDHGIAVVCSRKEGVLAGDVRRMGIEVRVLNARSGWDFTVRRKLLRVFRTRKPDIVHTFMFGFDLFANQAARAAGVPVVISSRRQLATWKQRRHVFIQKRANRLVDCIVANSRAVAEFAAKQENADPSLFRIIHNGINADEFVSGIDTRLVRERFQIPFHRHVIGIVANFSPVKDLHLFVETACALIKRRPDVHFVMVGTGLLVNEIERAIAECDLADCFTRANTITELADLYALMDVSVLCSKVEGFPNAVLESMAAGTPVVATAVGGTKELIEHGETGRLVTTRSPEDLANEIAWVLEHPEQSAAMAQRASQFVRTELTSEKMVDGYRALYSELLGKCSST